MVNAAARLSPVRFRRLVLLLEVTGRAGAQRELNQARRPLTASGLVGRMGREGPLVIDTDTSFRTIRRTTPD